jgi:hypothetical protein
MPAQTQRIQVLWYHPTTDSQLSCREAMDLSGPGLDKEEKYMFWFSIVKFKE